MDVYEKLGNHISKLGMGFPLRDDIIDILRENFSEQEAEAALAIPNRLMPLQPVPVDEIAAASSLDKGELASVLESLAERGLIFSGKTDDGSTGYALQQIGFGFPQSFFWKGEEDPHAKKMASMVGKYFNRHVTREAYSAGTKPFRYIPIKQSVEVDLQAVFPGHMMESVIDSAKIFALAHCPCRIAYSVSGRTCDHPTDVCLKFNDMAQYLIDRGLGKQITKEEALEVIQRSIDAGLVHFVDNAEGEINHNCNCCGCACWNVGSLKRRKIPRDDLMACYFIRETDESSCSGCGACERICPVACVAVTDGMSRVDMDWCIGCGVCSTVCDTDAITMIFRPDKKGQSPADSFIGLHETILKEKSENWD